MKNHNEKKNAGWKKKYKTLEVDPNKFDESIKSAVDKDLQKAINKPQTDLVKKEEEQQQEIDRLNILKKQHNDKMDRLMAATTKPKKKKKKKKKKKEKKEKKVKNK